MAKLKPRVSIVIPNFNGEHFIIQTLTAIKTHVKIAYEVIVIDNDSHDKSISLIHAWCTKNPEYKLYSLDSNIGASGACAYGVQKSQANYVLILNYDVCFTHNFLNHTISFLDRHPKIGAGQLKILRLDKKHYFDSAGDLITPLGFLAERAQGARDEGQFDYVSEIFSGKGAALIVRKDACLQAGNFDKDYFMFWEEPDLLWRIHKCGYRVVFLPMDTVWHHYGSSYKKKHAPLDDTQLVHITFLSCRNHILTICKNGVGLQGVVFLLMSVLSWIGIMIMFLAQRNAKRAFAIFLAFGALLVLISTIMHKRNQTKRLIGKGYENDSVWLTHVINHRSLNWYCNKGNAYIHNKPF